VVYDQALQAYILCDRVTADTARQALVVPNGLGDTPAWSPDGAHLVFPEIYFLPEPIATPAAGTAAVEEPPKYYSHVKRVAITDGSQVDLSGNATLLVEDTGPVYSPDGAWIAFARRGLDPQTWTLGRQLWLMRPDGSEQHALTSRPALNHAGIAWSPDGSKLAYMQFDQARPADPSEIWWQWSDGRPGDRIVTGGYAPAWLP
jgi:Tol biopolymer transport system component